MRHFSFLVLTIFCLFMMLPSLDSMAQNEAGIANIVVSEILPDPNGSNDFDTDGNGSADTNDEFIEIYNASDHATDISGWQLWDKGNGLWFIFPEDTIFAADSYVVVVAGIAEGGALPSLSTDNLAFEAERGGNGVLNNSGDNVVLYDPNSDTYRQLYYGNATPDDPHQYEDFSPTATRIGEIEAWGRPPEGVSLLRIDDENTQFWAHNLLSDQNASPGAPSTKRSASDPYLNEFVIDHRGADVNEFIEIHGDPDTDYQAFTVLQVEGAPDGAGRIDSVHPLTATNSDGLWSTGYLSSVLENGSLTLLLVEGFTGRVGDDIDTDDDRVIDAPRWVRIVDAIGIRNEPDGLLYADVILQATAEVSIGGASLVNARWQINDFNGNGLPCCTDISLGSTGMANSPMSENPTAPR